MDCGRLNQICCANLDPSPPFKQEDNFSYHHINMPIVKRPVGSSSPPKQYTQKSRKGKRAWRKNIDSTEIQNGLEELREELIQGYFLSCT